MTLSVIAGVAGVTAACVTGPGSIIFFAAVASAAGVAKDIIDATGNDDKSAPKGKEYHVGGHTVDMILSNTYDLIQETQRYVTMSEDTIISGLQENLATLNAGRTRPGLVSPQPSVVGKPTELAYVRDDLHFYPG